MAAVTNNNEVTVARCITPVLGQWRRDEFIETDKLKSDNWAGLKVGGTDPARDAGKNFFGRAPPLYWL